jgi:hypothetical protein
VRAAAAALTQHARAPEVRAACALMAALADEAEPEGLVATLLKVRCVCVVV